MTGISDNIRAARQKRNMSQDELAQAIGTTKSAISKYELGHREPSLDQIRRISAALNVSMWDILGLDELLQGYSVKYKMQILSGADREEAERLAKLLSKGPRAIYENFTDAEKAQFWEELFSDESVPLSPRSRIGAALDQMDDAGQEKVAGYAEDILPRHRRVDNPEK